MFAGNLLRQSARKQPKSTDPNQNLLSIPQVALKKSFFLQKKHRDELLYYKGKQRGANYSKAFRSLLENLRA